MRRFLAALTLWSLSAAAAAAATSGPARPIYLKPQVTVDGPTVRLGDLFDGLGARAATPVARAPEPGRRIELDARWLAAVAQAHALPWRPTSYLDKTVIQRASLVIDARAIEGRLRGALSGRGVSGNVSLTLDNPGVRLYLPAHAEPSVAVTGLSHDAKTGRFVAHVVAPAHGSPLARATVTGRAAQMTEIPVLARRIEPGNVIGRDDIDWIRVRADRVGRATLTEPEKLVGKSPRRPIRAGEAVLSGDLREPVVVAKSGLVTIRLETERMVLTAQGRALEPGAIGEVIRVVNTKSNKTIQGAVINSGTVRVYPTAAGGPVREVRR